ncbi:MAG: biopolymer transporter ExbD [Candidatus Latescibacterota bacterium]|nr:MAG: biopolymer transporter ExbD [Candidatus Latescibacterota bacterium]
MFQKQLRNAKGDEGNVNLTPLIDVSLVLVVMLMLATPLAFESSIAVNRSEAQAKSARQEKQVEFVELKVVSEDSVRVNREIVARASLRRTLEPLLTDSSRRAVVVTCAQGVSHGAFVDVLDVAKLSGAGEIAVMGR